MNYKIIPQKHFLKEVKRLAKRYKSLTVPSGLQPEGAKYEDFQSDKNLFLFM